MFLLNNWRLHRKCWEINFSTGGVYPFILEEQVCQLGAFSARSISIATQFNNEVIGSDIKNIQLEGKAFRSDDKSTRFGTKGFRSNDNLGDLLSRIRNGYFRSFEDVIVIDSKQNRELLDAFIYAGYIHSWKVINKSSEVEMGMENSLQVSLKYLKIYRQFVDLNNLRPGKRTYINTKRILKYSMNKIEEKINLILATSKGIFVIEL